MKQLKNYTEEIVRQYVNDRLEDKDMCLCDECRLDIMAIMLNKLPAHYIVTDIGALFVQLKSLDSQYNVDVSVALAEAVEIVKKSPRHNQTSSETKLF